MSLLPEVRWDYNYHPEKGTKEAELVEVLKNPR
jgi:coproporphyrinogen III oxidase